MTAPTSVPAGAPAVRGRLETRWSAQGDDNGEMILSLVNLSGETLSGFRLASTLLIRCTDPATVRRAELVRSEASYHEFAPPEGLVLTPGADWVFSVGALAQRPRHFTDGVLSAYLILTDGSLCDVETGDLKPDEVVAEAKAEILPAGKLTDPVGILPWPNKLSLGEFGSAPALLSPAPGASSEDRAVLSEVAALAKRLFPAEAAPFLPDPVADGHLLAFERRADLASNGYELVFAEDGIALRFADADGRFYGLVTLAQMLRAARLRPDSFRFAQSGTIVDAPRHGWRGCHLDVARQVYPIASVFRLVDILAWLKMNVLHWHLCDDEGWRLDIPARPQLTRIGARQGPGEKLLPQFGTGTGGRAGFYTGDEVRALVAHAGRLGVDILPEFDLPGHCTALLRACPELVDPDETPQSYRSVQGYANNALNPAVPAVYDLLADVFSEVAALFPFTYVHVGGDELPDGAWLGSPLARQLMAKEGLSGTASLQAYFLRRIQAMLARHGKRLVGWGEVAHGGGVSRDGTLLMAWQNAASGPALAGDGYDIVMCPAEAYYLDMAQSEAWFEPGVTWAGTTPPQKTYEFEAAASFSPEFSGRLKGVQACIWSETLNSRSRFNRMVFPRLGAIAEAGWSETGNKNWLRFAAQVALLPEL